MLPDGQVKTVDVSGTCTKSKNRQIPLVIVIVYIHMNLAYTNSTMFSPIKHCALLCNRSRRCNQDNFTSVLRQLKSIGTWLEIFFKDSLPVFKP